MLRNYNRYWNFSASMANLHEFWARQIRLGSNAWSWLNCFWRVETFILRNRRYHCRLPICENMFKITLIWNDDTYVFMLISQRLFMFFQHFVDKIWKFSFWFKSTITYTYKRLRIFLFVHTSILKFEAEIIFEYKLNAYSWTWTMYVRYVGGWSNVYGRNVSAIKPKRNSESIPDTHIWASHPTLHSPSSAERHQPSVFVHNFWIVSWAELLAFVNHGNKFY